MSSQRARLGLHAAVVTLCFTPLFWLVHAALTDGLGANPVEKVTHVTGEWALRLLLLVGVLRRLLFLEA